MFCICTRTHTYTSILGLRHNTLVSLSFWQEQILREKGLGSGGGGQTRLRSERQPVMADFMICMGTERRRVKESGDAEGCRWRRTQGVEEEARGWSEKKDWGGSKRGQRKGSEQRVAGQTTEEFLGSFGSNSLTWLLCELLFHYSWPFHKMITFSVCVQAMK